MNKQSGNYPKHVFPKSGGPVTPTVDSCKDKCGKQSGKCYCDPGCKK